MSVPFVVSRSVTSRSTVPAPVPIPQKMRKRSACSSNSSLPVVRANELPHPLYCLARLPRNALPLCCSRRSRWACSYSMQRVICASKGPCLVWAGANVWQRHDEAHEPAIGSSCHALICPRPPRPASGTRARHCASFKSYHRLWAGRCVWGSFLFFCDGESSRQHLKRCTVTSTRLHLASARAPPHITLLPSPPSRPPSPHYTSVPTANSSTPTKSTVHLLPTAIFNSHLSRRLSIHGHRHHHRPTRQQPHELVQHAQR